MVQGLVRVLENKNNDPRFFLPVEFESLFGSEEERKGVAAKDLVKLRLPSVRSTIKAPPGWCGVESDLKTAEIRGQAFIPGDVDLINLMVGKDTDFGLSKGRRVRLSYPQDAGILPANQKPEFLMAWCVEGKAPVPIKEEELDRDADGNLKHPPYDLHWSLAELSNATPREGLVERDRDQAKVANFSGAYGVVGNTLERRIEAQTGIKPEPGRGEELLLALKTRQPVSVAFLEDVAEWPKRGTEMRAASGRLRHFPVHSRELQGMPWRVRNSYLRAMGNEARNFFFQESVSATLSRACQSLNAWFRKMGMKARTNIGLYDAILTFCPLEERHVVAAAHQVFFTDVNCWRYHGRWFNYPIDTDYVYRWSWKTTEEEKKQLTDPAWEAMEEGRFNNLIASLNETKEAFHALQPWIKPRLNVV